MHLFFFGCLEDALIVFWKNTKKPLQHKPQRFFAFLSSLFSQQRQGPYRVFDGFETR